VAHHEAAHWETGTVLGRRPNEVSVFPEVDADGKHIGGYVGFSDQLRQADGRLKGGPADRRQAIAALWAALPGIDFRALRREMRECRQQAEELLDAHWPTIQAIATELMWLRRLSRPEIEAVLEGRV
jgi:hypothetical protein